MPEPFRVREVEQPEAPLVPAEEKPGTPISPNDNPMKSKEDLAELGDLTIWEGENKKKYVNEYFNTHNVSHEFMVKMPTSEIDKYIRAELEERKYEKTTKNYKEILAEIEREIGSEKLQLLERFRKITGYIRAVMKLRKAQELKNKYMG